MSAEKYRLISLAIEVEDCAARNYAAADFEDARATYFTALAHALRVAADKQTVLARAIRDDGR